MSAPLLDRDVQHVRDARPATLRWQCEESLRRLETDHVDLLCAFVKWYGLRLLVEQIEEMGRRANEAFLKQYERARVTAATRELLEQVATSS